jgi:hypothetical protein
MTNATLTRTPTASLVAVLALAQAVLGTSRALGWFEIGSDLFGRGIMILPIVGVMALVRGAMIAGIAMLYAFFAWGVLKGRPWARTVGLIAAAVSVVSYVLAQPRPSTT